MKPQVRASKGERKGTLVDRFLDIRQYPRFFHHLISFSPPSTLGDFCYYLHFTMGKLEGSGNFDVLASLYHIEVRLQEGKEFHHKLSSLPSSRPESWG